MKRHFSLAAALTLAFSPAWTLHAAEDPSDDPTLVHDQAKAVGDTVKRDSKVVADAAKDGAKQVAVAAKEVAHEVAATAKEGAREVASTAKRGAARAKAAARGDRAPDQPAKPKPDSTPSP